MNKPFVIITGASSGIGAGIAKLFSQSEYNLALLARNVKAMEDLKLANAICIETDVTDIESTNAAILQAEKHFISFSLENIDLIFFKCFSQSENIVWRFQ